MSHLLVGIFGKNPATTVVSIDEGDMDNWWAMGQQTLQNAKALNYY